MPNKPKIAMRLFFVRLPTRLITILRTVNANRSHSHRQNWRGSPTNRNDRPESGRNRNALLLKSQYNHINHLDRRLSIVSNSVLALEGKFVSLENRFQGLENKFELLEKNIELKISQAINSNMKWSIDLIAIIVTVLKLADMLIPLLQP